MQKKSHIFELSQEETVLTENVKAYLKNSM